MARKPRDYKTEEQRRNARARELGYTSRGQLRNRLRKGLVRPTYEHGRIRSIEPVASEWRPPVYARAGFSSDSDYRDARNSAREWSLRHSHLPVSEYSPRFTPERLRAYLLAFVEYRNHETRMFHLYQYLVNIMHYITEDQWTDDPYSGRRYV